MKFNVVGAGSDPFLHVSLEYGEELNCESDSMVSMESNLDLTGELKGGVLGAIGRKLVNDESFFTQSIRASRGPGDVLLSPELQGDIKILTCSGSTQYNLNDGAFLACESTVDMSVVTQRLDRAIFAGTGGLFISKTSGYGQIAVSGFGSLFEMEVTPDNPILVDNNHVVAWDCRLKHDLSVSTNKSKGFLSNLVNSAISGEGLVCKFTGTGKVVICSRNRSSFLAWILARLQPRN